MDDFQADEETGFVVEDVSKVVKESIEATVGKSTFEHSRVNDWSNGIVEQCLSQLGKMGKPYKYIVNCTIMQKTGAGLQTASSCFWDNATDGKQSWMVSLAYAAPV